MEKQVLEESTGTVKRDFVLPSAPVLKRVNCVYVPASDPYLTIQWFGQYFGLHRQMVQRDTNGESLELGNGMELFITRGDTGSRMSFQTDVWSGPDFQLPMLSFEVDDIVNLHHSLQEGGAMVEEMRDDGGCGMGFYFYDPDGNKFSAWELQTMVRWREDGHGTASTNWQERFGFDNCYFNGDVEAFMNLVSSGSRGSTRRVQIVGHKALQETDPEGLQELIGALERCNRQYPDRAFRIVYRD